MVTVISLDNRPEIEVVRATTFVADTVGRTARTPDEDEIRRAWERLWAHENLNARCRVMADRLETK